MKVLIIADSPSWAIGKLSEAIIKHKGENSPDMALIFVHPRDAMLEKSINLVKAQIADADVIHFQYWNTAQQLIKAIPELKNRKTVLTHHNQKNLLSEDWAALGIKQHVVHTKKSKEVLEKAGYKNVKIIQHGIDHKLFEFRDERPTEKMFGYVGRVVPWKGLKEISKASRELGYPLLMMGKQDKIDYWESIDMYDRNNIIGGYINCKDQERFEAYNDMSVYVGNSADGREEGPLGLLEAMACGTPVVTTPSGEAADICVDGKNCLMVPFEDYDALKKAMNRLMTDDKLADELRSNAWNTVKGMTEEKMALEYRRLYKKVLYENKPLISVIVPYTKDRQEFVDQIKAAYKGQDYAAIEVLAVEDSEQGYNLAKMRNLAAIDADGEILIFNDSRILPDKDVAEVVINYFNMYQDSNRVWIFGNKGGNKKSFVENFSAIRRDHFIRGGMCNERINLYGGMSQELRERFMFSNFQFVFADDMKATTLCSTHKTRDRRQQIIKSKFQLYKMGL